MGQRWKCVFENFCADREDCEMERVQEFAIGLDACKVSLAGWAWKKAMTLSWRWNVFDTIGEEKWLGTSRHCWWKVDHVTFWPSVTILCDRAKRVSGKFDRFGKRLLNLLPESPKDEALREIFQKEFPPIWRLQDKPSWGPKWSHVNLILDYCLTGHLNNESFQRISNKFLWTSACHPLLGQTWPINV